MNSDEKICAFCAEIIKKNAILCRYCKSSINGDVNTLTLHSIKSNTSEQSSVKHTIAQRQPIENIEKTQWFYKEGFEEHGPVDYWAFVNLICSGVVNPYIKIKLNQEDEWEELKDIPEALKLIQKYSSEALDPNSPDTNYSNKYNVPLERNPSRLFAWCLIVSPIVHDVLLSLVIDNYQRPNLNFTGPNVEYSLLYILSYWAVALPCVFLDGTQLKKSGIKKVANWNFLILPIYLFSRKIAVEKAFNTGQINSSSSPHWSFLILACVISYMLYPGSG